MKALVILSVILAICSSYVLQKRSLLGGHQHHHQQHPLPHRGHQRRQLLNQSRFRHNNNLQDARHGRNGDLEENNLHEHQNDLGETDYRSAPAGYLPPTDDYEDDLTSYTANDDVASYEDHSQYSAETVDEYDYSSDGRNDSNDNLEIQGEYDVDSLGQYEEENLGQQYGEETKPDNDRANLDQYREDYDVQDGFEEESLAVGSTSQEYDPVVDINDLKSNPADGLYKAPLEDNIIETIDSGSENAATNINNVSESYGVPADDSNDLDVDETNIAPEGGNINSADDIYGAPSDLVENKPADELYGAPTVGDVIETTDKISDSESTEESKESADYLHSAPSDKLNDDAYIAPVKSDTSSPDDTYGAPSKSTESKYPVESVDLSEETDLTPPPANDDADKKITQLDYAAPSNPLENEYLSPAGSPTSDYSVLGSYDTQFGSIISDSGSLARHTCPGGSIEHCVTVCPGVTARVFGACVQECANRCS